MYGSGLNGLFTAMLVLGAVVGAAIFAILFWLVPLIWEWVKPWLHAMTT
jgi:hypothetical protein